MKVRRVVVGVAATVLVLGMWAVAASDLSDSQMSGVWGGGYCDQACNYAGSGGCDPPGGVNCYWTQNKTVCNGTVEQGYCGTDEYHCTMESGQGWVCYQDPPDGEDCALQQYQRAYCHLLAGGICGTIDPDDFDSAYCTGEIDNCWDEEY